MKRLSSIGELGWFRNKVLAQEKLRKTRIHVCMTGCRAYGAAEVRDALEGELVKQGLSDQVEVRSTGCHGLCAKAPVISIDPLGIQYQEVAPEDAAEIVEKTVIEQEVIERLLYVDPKTEEKIPLEKDIPFYSRQTRVLRWRIR